MTSTLTLTCLSTCPGIDCLLLSDLEDIELATDYEDTLIMRGDEEIKIKIV
jgi:hypothetical protein